MALTHNKPRTYELLPSAYRDYPMGVTSIYEGAAVSNAGSPYQDNAENLVAGDDFLGFANTYENNLSGTESSMTINLVTEGVIKLVVTGVTSASLGAIVYASDNDTFTTTSSGNTPIGKVVQIVSGTTVMVKFQGIGYRSI